MLDLIRGTLLLPLDYLKRGESSRVDKLFPKHGDKQTYPIIAITGTNGKQLTVALLPTWQIQGI
jgi:folylpolyglutamate synthase/dihydropteroate synthase